MRVIAGQAKGHRLKGPPSTRTRPMADKIRESLFSALGSLGVRPTTVLDLYAGTGSIGIEALSRGARQADFVERDRAACQVIRENLERTRFQDRGTVHCESIDRFLRRASGAYDLVVLDPPYADPAIMETIGRVCESALVQSGTVVVLGHWPRLDTSQPIAGAQRILHRCHGDSCYSVFLVDRSPDTGAERTTTPPEGGGGDR